MKLKGHINININTNKVNYDISIRRNVTIIKGDSGTGKSSLIDIIEDYNNNVEDIYIQSDYDCIVLDDTNWSICKVENKKIFFMDEANLFLKTPEFGKIISKGNDNYFVIISREYDFTNISYSIHEIYKLEYNSLDNTNYNKGLYGQIIDRSSFQNENSKILVEDSKLGYQMYNKIFNGYVESSNGKNNIINLVDKLVDIVIIVDGAAFGANIDKILKKMEKKEIDYLIYMPESFEYLLLRLNIFSKVLNQDIFIHPENYIDSEEFSSYEKFFYDYIVRLTSGKLNKYRYSKKYINERYLEEEILEEFKNLLPKKLIQKFKLSNIKDNVTNLDWS